MAAIHVHEFMTLDGVIDAPTWAIEYEFLPEMEKSIGAVTKSCRDILLGRTTYEMFATRCSSQRGRREPRMTIQRRRSTTTPPSTSSLRRSRLRRSGTRESSGRVDEQLQLVDLPVAHMSPTSSFRLSGATPSARSRGSDPRISGTTPTRSVREHRSDQRGARSLEVDRLLAARSVPDGPAADSSHDER